MKRKIQLTREDLQRLVTESVNEILSSEENIDNLPEYIDTDTLLNIRKDALNLYKQINDFSKKLQNIGDDFYDKTTDVEIDRGEDEDDPFTEGYLDVEDCFSNLKELAKKYENVADELYLEFNSKRGVFYDILKNLPNIYNDINDELSY